jgi:hypothetical protein
MGRNHSNHGVLANGATWSVQVPFAPRVHVKRVQLEAEKFTAETKKWKY